MAFDSSNLVSIGGPTLKSNYDQVLDNGLFLHDDVLQIDLDTDIRIGATSAVQIADYDLFGTALFDAGSTFNLDSGLIKRSGSGNLDFIPNNSTSFAAGQSGLSVDPLDTTVYSSSTSDGFFVSVWDGAQYDPSFVIEGFNMFLYHNTTERIFINANNGTFSLNEDVAVNVNSFRYESSGNRLRLLEGVTTALDFNADSRIYGFNNQFDTSEFIRMRLDSQVGIEFRSNISSIDYEWFFTHDAGGGFNITPSVISGTPINNNWQILNINGFIGVRSTAAGTTQASINAVLNAAGNNGAMFWNQSLPDLVISDGGNWRRCNATVI